MTPGPAASGGDGPPSSPSPPGASPPAAWIPAFFPGQVGGWRFESDTQRSGAAPGAGAGASPAPSAAPDAPAPSDEPAAIVVPAGGSDGGGNGPRSDSAGGPGPAAPLAPGIAGPFGNDPLTRLALLSAAISTGTTLAFAFLLFGRRRRDDEFDEQALATAAATPYGMPAVAPQMPRFDPGTGGTDVDLPRWRRPSLMAARKSDPVRGFDTPARLTFDGSKAAAAEVERREVRYRLVRLLDRPDELTATTVGSLDAGDQVEILESSGLYRRVATPDGRTGWLHKMTLGDAIATPTLDDDDGDLDPDVLMAYLAARARG